MLITLLVDRPKKAGRQRTRRAPDRSGHVNATTRRCRSDCRQWQANQRPAAAPRAEQGPPSFVPPRPRAFSSQCGGRTLADKGGGSPRDTGAGRGASTRQAQRRWQSTPLEIALSGRSRNQGDPLFSSVGGRRSKGGGVSPYHADICRCVPGSTRCLGWQCAS